MDATQIEFNYITGRTSTPKKQFRKLKTSFQSISHVDFYQNNTDCSLYSSFSFHVHNNSFDLSENSDVFVLNNFILKYFNV